MREGVNKVALCLFEHNEKAYHAAVRMMEQYGKAAIVHPTGTGKSYIAFKLIEDNPEKVVIWLSPSEYIFKTQLESLKRNDPDFPLANVHFYTYAKLMCCTQAQLDEIAAQKPAYIILDEFHRAGAECWGESTVALLKLCPDAKLLGLTATNIRYLDNNRDMAEELFDSRVASNMTLGEAVVRGILPAPKYVTTVYQYQKTLAKYQARVDNLRAPGIQDVNQKYLDALRRALEQADGLDRVFAHHITNKAGKYIVFCANKEHMDEMVSHVPEWFAGVNPDVVVYEAYSDDPNTDKAFADFKTDTSDRLKLLFCIDMLNEGVHVEGISGVILFRPTISPIIYKQQIGRALTAGDTAAPLILDVVNNFEGLTSISGLQSEMQEAVHRLYANGEGDKIVTERFEVIEQVHDCRVLFEQLQASLSSGWEHYFSEASIYYAGVSASGRVERNFVGGAPLPPGRNSGDSCASYLPDRVCGLGNVGTVHTACLGRRCGSSFLRHRGCSADGKQRDGDSVFYAAHAGLCGSSRLRYYKGGLGHGGRMPAGAKANGSVCARQRAGRPHDHPLAGTEKAGNKSYLRAADGNVRPTRTNETDHLSGSAGISQRSGRNCFKAADAD